MSTTAAIIRSRNIVRSAWTGLAAKLLSVGISLLMVPLGIHYLGKDDYGLWITASSFIALIGFMDGGAGNAAVNMVSYAKGNDASKIQVIVSTFLYLLMIFSIVGAVVFACFWPYVPWGRLLGLPRDSGNVSSLILVIGMFFFVSMPLTLVGKVQRGMQEGFLESGWNAVGAVFSLLLVYGVIQFDGGFLAFATAVLLGPALAAALSNFHYWFFARPTIQPRGVLFDVAVAKSAVHAGAMFLILQVATVIQGQVDNLLIANMIGPSAVTDYAVCMRLFLLFPMLIGLFVAPLWPAYREAIASGETLWIRKVFLKSISISLIIGLPVAFVLAAFGSDIMIAWVETVSVSSAMLLGCAIWMLFNVVGSSLAMLFNGLQLIRIQIWAAVISSILNVIFSIYLINQIGVAGAVWGSVLGWLIGTLLPYLLVTLRIFRNEIKLNGD
jgi:O-antigen/teichoic acid export membrane protein